MTFPNLSDLFNHTFKHQTVLLNGINLHYVTGGKGEPLILLHGWPQTWYAYRQIMTELANHYTVIVPDLRGLGDSSKPSSGYDTYTVADDIYHLVRHLGYPTINLLGHDFGANVAYAYAASYRNEVKKLIFLDVGILDNNIESLPMLNRKGKSLWWFPFHMLTELPEALIKGNERTYLSWFYTHSAFNQSAFTEADINEYTRTYSLPGTMKAGFEFYRAIFQDIDQNARQAQTKLQMPVLALGGDHSFSLKPYESWLTVCENIQGGVINDCGHFIAEEQPEQLTKELLSFLNKQDD